MSSFSSAFTFTNNVHQGVGALVEILVLVLAFGACPSNAGRVVRLLKALSSLLVWRVVQEALMLRV